MSSEEDIQKWNRDARSNDLQISPSCSSFEVLDPHDPVISRLATQLFRRTNDYLQGEMAAGQEYYTLLEDINRLAITKYTDLRNLAINLNKALTDYNEMYAEQIRPLLQQIDDIDEQVSRFEANAYRLDAYTKQLKARFKELEERPLFPRDRDWVKPWGTAGNVYKRLSVYTQKLLNRLRQNSWHQTEFRNSETL